MLKTLEQKRAIYALERINKQKNDPKNSGDYGRHVRKMPAMILNNGLGQALAFLLADGNPASSGALYKDFQNWVCGNKKDDNDYPRLIYNNEKDKDGKDKDLILLLMDKDRSHYMEAQQEILSLLTWMKKFADAYLPKSAGGRN